MSWSPSRVVFGFGFEWSIDEIHYCVCSDVISLLSNTSAWPSSGLRVFPLWDLICRYVEVLIRGAAEILLCYEQVEEMNIKGLVIGYPLELTGFQGKQVGCLTFSFVVRSTMLASRNP